MRYVLITGASGGVKKLQQALADDWRIEHKWQPDRNGGEIC